MRYLGNLFVSLDQFGNVLAGGNPDNTISSRVGYYTNHYDKRSKPRQWRLFESIINTAFYPIDGENHCHEAFHNDAGEKFDNQTSDLMIALLAIFIIPGCVLIGVLLYTLYVLKFVSPKNINRNNNITKRLQSAEVKLNGTLHELNEHKVEIDENLTSALDKTRTTFHLVAEKIEGMVEMIKRFEAHKNSSDESPS